MTADLVFYGFNSATTTLDRSIRTIGVGYGEKIKGTVTWGVILHPQGVVVVDTGMNKRIIDARDTTWGTNRLGIPEMRAGQEVEARLRSIDLQPSDVRYVINTHLHGDHVGGNLDLPTATFICQKDEYEYAHDPDIPSMIREYPTHEIAGDRLEYKLIEGELDLFGDGTIRMFRTPGHTPGHQSLLVQLKETGPVIMTGDALAAKELLDDMTLPGICWWFSEYVKSRRQLRALQQELGARWFYTHDADTFGALGWEEGGAYR